MYLATQLHLTENINKVIFLSDIKGVDINILIAKIHL